MRRLTLLLLAAVGLMLVVPSTAWSAPASAWSIPANAWSVPADPRVTAAVEAWKTGPVYVDPQYAQTADGQLPGMVERLGKSNLSVYVAVVPSGAWFQEKGDVALLAGWLATANAKPGLYLVMDGDTTTGVDHLVRAAGPGHTYGLSKDSLVEQLSEYLDGVRVSDRYDAEPARTKPLPPDEKRTYERERFTVGKAIGNGLGGVALGLFGGALLAGCVLGVAALVARRAGGRL